MGFKSEERLEMERFVDALRLFMGKGPLYKPERNEACLNWFHRTVSDGNRRTPRLVEAAVNVRLR